MFVVWEPILPTDWFRPSRFVQHRIPDSRVVQFWDKGHLVAKELRAHVPGSQVDGRSKILWDVVALYPKDAQWDSAPVFFGGPVVRAAPEVARKLEVFAIRRFSGCAKDALLNSSPFSPNRSPQKLKLELGLQLKSVQDADYNSPALQKPE